MLHKMHMKTKVRVSENKGKHGRQKGSEEEKQPNLSSKDLQPAK